MPHTLLLLAALIVALTTAPNASAARGPSMKQVRAAVTTAKPLGAGEYRVSHRVGAVGLGHYLAIGVRIDKGSDCGDHDSVAYPCSWVTPFLVVVNDAGKVEATVKIPTVKQAHSSFRWGVAKLKDYDGDGRLELAVIFGYVHHPVTVQEEEHHREIAWFDFKTPAKPRKQGGLLLGYHMGDPDEAPALKTTFRYAKTKGGKVDIVTKTTDTMMADEPKASTKTLSYDAKLDAWK